MTHQPDHSDEFFRGLAQLQSAYRDVSFSYLAVRHRNDFVLVQGRVLMRAEPASFRHEHFASDNVRAGRYRLAELGLDTQKLVVALRAGALSTPGGELIFPRSDTGAVRTTYQPFFNDSVPRQDRIDVLTLWGAKRWGYIRQPHVDWELRAAETPYDGLADLMNDFGTGPFVGDEISVEFVALNVAGIDAAVSTIAGETATIGILLAAGLPRDRARLGYRVVVSQGHVDRRGVCQPSDMVWGEKNGLQNGVATIAVPQGAVLHCFVSYAGIPQQHWWVTDPANVQNPRRAVYEAFDGRLEILTSFFAEPHAKHGAENLEAGVAWLFWLLGFSVAHLGGTQRTRDAPDLVVIAPNGSVGIIECTTGLLKTENKMPKVVARAEAVRARLRASGNGHLHVLPAMVTSMTRDEIKADIEQAEKLGVGILTREELLEALNRTVVLDNPQQLYDDVERGVREAGAKHEAKPTPPTNDASEV
jgi:hypothetical protein